MSMTRNMTRGLAAVAALAACCALAACGSSSSTSSNSSASATATTAGSSGAGTSSSRATLAACLKKHGVTLPARPPGAGGGPGGAPGGGAAPPAGGTPPAGGYGAGGGRRLFGGGGGVAANPKLRAAFQACGGDRFRGRPGGGSPGNSATFRAALDKYVTCVRQHGYNLPKPNTSGKGPVFPASIQSNTKFQSASKACQSLLARPGGAPSGSAPPSA